MAFKVIQSLDADNTTPLGGFNKKTKKANPTEVEGYYLGSRKVESKKAKSGYAYIHFLQTPKGNLGVWGKTDLDRKVLTVEPGTMVRITQSGMRATPNGEMYVFTVEQDQDNVIEVNLSTEGNDGGSGQGTDDGGDVDSSDDSDGNDAGADDAEIAAAAAAQRAKVQAILNRNKKA